MQKLGFLESSVVEISELVEVLLQFWGAQTVKGAEQETLEVRDGGVHLGKPFVHVLGWRGARLDLLAVFEIQHAERPSSVGADAELVAQAIAERVHGVQWIPTEFALDSEGKIFDRAVSLKEVESLLANRLGDGEQLVKIDESLVDDDVEST